MKTLRLLLLAGFLVVLGLADPAAGQVKKKPEEPIKDKKLASIVKDFKHKDAKNRRAALDELEQMAEVRPSDAKPALRYVFPLIKDPDASVRRAAITVLDTLEADPKEFVPPLVDLLKKEKDAAVRLAAVTAVKHIGPPAKAAAPVLETIQKAIKDNPKEKVLAAEVNAALRQINKK